MLLVHFELYVQLDERRAGSVLEVNGAGVDDFARFVRGPLEMLANVQRASRNDAGTHVGLSSSECNRWLSFAKCSACSAPGNTRV